jgi:hypothetical protein
MKKPSKTATRNRASVKNRRVTPRTAKSSRTADAGKREAAKTSSAIGAREGTKLATVISMLRHPKGATIEAMCKATGWQSHSVRGALAGTIKKKLGLNVLSEKGDGMRFYRITP